MGGLIKELAFVGLTGRGPIQPHNGRIAIFRGRQNQFRRIPSLGHRSGRDFFSNDHGPFTGIRVRERHKTNTSDRRPSLVSRRFFGVQRPAQTVAGAHSDADTYNGQHESPLPKDRGGNLDGFDCPIAGRVHCPFPLSFRSDHHPDGAIFEGKSGEDNEDVTNRN